MRIGLGDYLRDRIYTILLNTICVFFLSAFLAGTGVSSGVIIIIIIVWTMVLSIYYIVSFLLKRKHFNELSSVMHSLDKRYLFVEVIDKPKNLDDKFYYELMRKAGKSMLENVSKHQSMQQEYKEYIEQWIHEIKVPITSVKLMCENNKDAKTRKILSQIERIDNDVERALYYARLGYVANDYMIKETLLNDIVTEVISRNKQVLIANKIKIETDNLFVKVHTDGKWIEFILNQILSNSIKYKSEVNAGSHLISEENLTLKKSEVTEIYEKVGHKVSITARKHEFHTTLEIKDNGIGIKEDELHRIFQKGFTGSNGRIGARSTGIGLYLCSKLCERLGISITAESEYCSGTLITLSFPDSSFLSKM